MPHSVLVVDDDPEIRELLCAYLTGRGWLTEEATTLSEARNRLHARTFSHSLDTVVVDHRLPDGDGVELIGLATSLGLATVLMTAFPAVESTLAGMQAGASTVLAKPFRLKDLATELASGREKMLSRRLELGALQLFEDSVQEVVDPGLEDRLMALVQLAGGQLVEDPSGVQLGHRWVRTAPRFLPWVRAVHFALLRKNKLERNL